jgi:hypothetical protein
MWQDLCQSLGMAHHQTSAYHPQANGLVEWFHRQLKDALRARLCGLDWAEHLPWVLWGLRADPKEGSAVSSAELVLGSQLVLPGQLLDTPDWPLQDLGRVRQQMTAASGGLPTRPLRGEQLDSYCPPQLFKAELVYIKVWPASLLCSLSTRGHIESSGGARRCSWLTSAAALSRSRQTG